MKQLLPGIALAAVLVLGGLGPAGAQAVDPNAPGSASGGLQAQVTQPGQQDRMGRADQGSGSPGRADHRSGGSDVTALGALGVAQGGRGMSEEPTRAAEGTRSHADSDDQRRGDGVHPHR